ncbi:MAG: nucleotidyl transferase AbiEii/AbiGii toxin family protein [Elusimicrobia bacterium]|nr:nucleotidyl transferase AbiEii/AbiGii toxin family protein [Elusimicrobiota bacterium]
MQRLLALIKETPIRTESEKWNLSREYLQVAALKSIFASSMGSALAFQGGTCLRICHRLRRYSEDLDFSLTGPPARYDFVKLHAALFRDLSRRGFKVDGKVAEDKTVQKAFVRVGGLPELLGLSLSRNQKLAIKLEVDLRPPLKGVRETYFVSRMGELFPVLKYDLPTLFAGKALALLFRPYQRGRDYYDLAWFLGQRIKGNMDYFKAGVEQSAPHAVIGPLSTRMDSWDDVLKVLARKAAAVDAAKLVDDLRPFLEDASDLTWIRDCRRVFSQLFMQD